MKILRVKPGSSEVRRLGSRSAAPSPEIEAKVRTILSEIRAGGKAAATTYARQFDGLKGSLEIRPAAVAKAADKASPSLVSALRKAVRNVRRFHEHQKEMSWQFRGSDGEVLGQRIRPLHRVGLYVPCGLGVYPSTLVMNAVPAMVAGVPELVVTTPARDGLPPAIAWLLREFGISEAYHIGGAQAIGLLAYGGKGIAPVDKIVGPANVWAAVAKREVFGTVDIDMIAGPSEILVLADSSADPDWVAADLLSQTEHGSGFEAAVCITTDRDFAQQVAECVQIQVEASPVRETLEHALSRHGRILLVENWDDGVAIANQLAPEHCEVMVRDADNLAERILNAGALFIGPWSSEPVGDYFAGPNHVLPTNGTARFASPLGVYDFIKRTSIIRYSAKAMQRHGKSIAVLADSERFFHHAAAVRKRL